jgi:hypothetical protein
MRTTMRALVLFLATLLASLLACSSQLVVKAASCTEPCCGGRSALLDCGENRNISCVESGDPCMAQAFGCVGGVFFERAQDPPPARCSESDGGPDATKANEPDGGLFAAEDAGADGDTDATADGGGPDATADGGGPDAALGDAPDGP